MVARWKGVGVWEKMVNGFSGTTWLLPNSHGDVKYSTEYICMTHGHRHQCGDDLREWWGLGGERHRGKPK